MGGDGRSVPEPSRARVEVVQRGTERHYLRTYPADHVDWTPPRMISPLVGDTEDPIAVSERIGWQVRVTAAAADSDRVAVETVTATTDRTVEVDEVRGDPLSRALSWRTTQPPGRDDARDLGRWLADLHTTEPQPDVGIAPWLESVRQRLSKTPPPGRLADAALERLGRLGNDGRVAVGLSHGDLSHSNVLWDRATRRWGVIDFEHGYSRPVSHDLAVLVTNLLVTALKPTVRTGAVSDVVHGVTAGYRDAVSSADVALDVAWVAALAWLADDFLPRTTERTAGRVAVRARLSGLERLAAAD